MKKTATIEWLTLGLLIGCYVIWIATLFFAAAVSLWIAVPVLALTITLHSSLQHEVLHGHPLPNQRASDALVFPAIGLAIPYQRFRDTHLTHHKNELLTDPYDDPESNYLDPKVWRNLPIWQQRALMLNNTLMGRMTLGPLIGTLAFYRSDFALIAQGNRAVQRAWVLHALGVLPVLAIVTLSSMPFWAYVFGAYLGLSILKVRTFLEHRADARVAGRSVIIEDTGAFALLFLNNNFHAVHHAHPHVAWYDLPALYSARQALFLRRNGGYRYGSYREIFAAYFLRAKDPVAHPLIDK